MGNLTKKRVNVKKTKHRKYGELKDITDVVIIDTRYRYYRNLYSIYCSRDRRPRKIVFEKMHTLNGLIVSKVII